MIMYGAILSLGAAATVYVLIAQPTKSDLSKVKVVGSNMCEYVLREVGKLCTWTNEDGMVQR